MSDSKIYDEDGMRLTDCCGCLSTYDATGTLYCKKCFEGVEVGEGDGEEYKEDSE